MTSSKISTIAMPFLSGKTTTRPNHIFVDAVRFWSMLGVVLLHSFQNFKMFYPGDEALALPLICLTKFGTIGFFLISGFLLGERMDTVAVVPYLSRRLKNLLFPWCLWFGGYVLCLLAKNAAGSHIDGSFPKSWLHALFSDIWSAMFESSYWFVPNLALGMCVLLLFRRHLYNPIFGACLFAVNLMYVANLYGQWFLSTHTTALFGFICYLWLGSFAARHFSGLSRFMERVTIWHLALLGVAVWTVACGEARLLLALRSIDPTSTLRLSNQVFSILVCLLLLKLKSPSWPGFVHVRQQTFGIYLIHWIYLRTAVRGLMWLLARAVPGYSPSVGVSLLLCVVVFVLTYGASLLTTRFLAGVEQLRWTVGLKPRKAARVEHLAAM